MKTKLLASPMILPFLVSIAFMGTAFGEQVSSTILISSQRSYIDLSVKNTQGYDLACSTYVATLQLANSEFNDVVGELEFELGPVYVTANQSLTFPKLGLEEIKGLKKDGNVVIVYKASVSHRECHEAKFQDYCEWAERDDEEEYTLDRIKDEAGTSDCQKIEDNIGRWLNLGREGIANVKPLSFLHRVENLKLHRNKIHFIEPLQKMKSLTSINLDGNPLRALSPIFNNPVLKTVRANDTLVSYLDRSLMLPALEILELRGTPYAEKHPPQSPIGF